MTETAIGPMRACTKCGVEKPLDDEHFHRLSRGAGKPRAPYPSYCRECYRLGVREYQAARYGERREEILARNKAYRDSNADKVETWEARRGDRSEYYSRQKKARWAATTPEERAEKAERLRQWKAENPDKVRAMWQRTYARNKEKIIARGLEWARRNPVRAAANRDRRRARDLGAEGSYTQDDVSALLKSQGRVCRYCQTALTKFHVDHFIPLARGGSNWPSNLVLSCPSCNCSKSDKMPWEFRPDLFSEP